MRALELFKKEEQRLKKAGKECARDELLLIFEHFLGLKRIDLLLDKQELDFKQTRLIEEKTDLRLKDLPCQYIIGETEFLGRRIRLDENVLIPRFDTERLVEEALRLARPNENVLDLCTGSGIIAISLKCERLDLNVCASDISEKALKIAARNAALNEAQIEFIHSDMFLGLSGRRFDLICSNPPYISREEMQGLSKDVKNEPELALFGGEDGLDFYRLIASEAKNHLNEGGRLVLEIGYLQAEPVRGLLEENFKDIRLIKDYSGLDRVISAGLR